MWDLGRLDLGDTIDVHHADGTSSTWRVTGRSSYPKDELPVDALFTRFGTPRVVLIRCGGTFDRRAGAHSHNIVVIADQV